MQRMTQPAELDYGREEVSALRQRAKRFARWTWRLMAGLVLVAVLSHAVWLAWVTLKLNRAIAALAAAGEPSTPATLQPPVPPGHNAYDDYVAAGKITSRETTAELRIDVLDPLAPPPFEFERTRWKAYIDDCAAAIPFIDAADGAPVNVMTRQMVSPLFQQLLPELNQFRSVATFQGARAELAHDAGRDDLAIHHLSVIDPLSVAAASHPSLVGMLVGVGIRSLGAAHYLNIAHTLRIGTQPGDARPEQVKKAIEVLLDFRASGAEQLAAFRGERATQIDTLAAMDNGTMGSLLSPRQSQGWAIGRYFVRPYIRANSLTCVETTTQVIGMLNEPDWPSAKQRLLIVAPSSRLGGPFKFFAQMLLPSFDRAIEVSYHDRTDRTLAAIALAVRWYELDHGKRPASLADLVPQYLSAVPRDPMASNQPIQARLAGADPIIWSVGKNGTDEHGSQGVPGNRAGGNQGLEWAMQDRVEQLAGHPRDLSPDMQRLVDLDLDEPILSARPATRPTTQPATAASAISPPDWDDITSMTAWAENGGIASLKTRRDVYRALRFAIEDGQPATRPATQLAPAVVGTVTLGTQNVYQYAIYSDGGLLLTWPDGVSLHHRWNPAGPNPDDRGFWR
ncbi:MAG: hypothetical protein JWM57_2221 [Phycisphaerales bacterium]|nr:hypothetical protein [Phycisphaerales bacterium]